MDEKRQVMEAKAAQNAENCEGYVVTKRLLMDIFINGWIAGEQYDPSPDTVRAVDLVNKAAIDRHNEIRDALGTIGEGVAFLAKRQGELQATALRGADRDVAILKHLQEIGDKFGVMLDHIKAGNARIEEAYSVARATASHMNDQDAMLGTLEVQANRIAKDIGEKVEAVQSQLVDIELIAARVEGYVEAPEVVNVRETTEPMHAEVKAQPVDAKTPEGEAHHAWVVWAYRGYQNPTYGLDVPQVNQLKAAFIAGYLEARRDKGKTDPGYGPRKDADKISLGGDMGAIRWKGFARNIDPHIGMDIADNRDDKSVIWVRAGGEVRDMGTNSERFRAFDMMSGDTLIWFDGKLYTLEGSSLIPRENGA